jgi:ketosteroid isomerase-like protein
MRVLTLFLLSACLTFAAAAGNARESNRDLKRQVMESERAFAAAMQARDFQAFGHYIADEAIFFGPAGPLRGKPAITRAWRAFFDKPQAPFRWEPEEVEVVQSGTLAYSGGPIYNAAGERIGRFNSIWRLEAPGKWRVVFDRGSDFTTPAAPKK